MLPPPIETEDEIVIGGSFRESLDGHGHGQGGAALPPPPEPDFAHGSDSSSARGSNSSFPCVLFFFWITRLVTH